MTPNVRDGALLLSAFILMVLTTVVWILTR